MATTCLCGFKFATVEALHAHGTKFGHLFQCHCGVVVGSKIALENHKRDTKHAKQDKSDTHLDLTGTPTAARTCGLCVKNKPFADVHARDQHVADKHNPCPLCAQVFGATADRLRHQKATGHCYCTEHDLAFNGVAELDVHKRADAHISSYECTDCDRSFRSDVALDDHLDSKGHRHVVAQAALRKLEADTAATKLAEIERTNLHCSACNRTFVHLAAFTQHKESLKHKPLSELKCPLSKDCTSTFSSPSALLFHLEGGGCKSGMTRNKLNAVVYQHDSDHLITSTSHVNRVINASVVGASHASTAPGSSASNRARSVSLDSTSKKGSLVGAADASDASSLLSSGVTLHESQCYSIAGSEAEFVEVTSASETASTLSGGGVILTPSTSETNSTRGISTPTASVLSDGGVILTPPTCSYMSGSSALSDWSFMNSTRMMTPSSASVDGSSVDTITFDTASRRWPCQSCPQSFRKKKDLLQHMKSVVHAPKIFHCPADLPGLPGPHKSIVSFKTLSGLAQHVEAGSCKGGKAALGFIVGIFEKQIQAKLGKSVKLLKE